MQTITIFGTASISHVAARTITIPAPVVLHELEKDREVLTAPAAS